MKFLYLFCLLIFGIITARADFFPGTDVPLMDDFVSDENETFSFDTPAGQIVTFVAKTNRSASEIRSFYDTALLELGWNKTNASSYKRDQDKLTLRIIPSKAGTKVKIQVTFPNK